MLALQAKPDGPNGGKRGDVSGFVGQWHVFWLVPRKKTFFDDAWGYWLRTYGGPLVVLC